MSFRDRESRRDRFDTERDYDPSIMRDPATANARIFVGNLPVPSVSKADMEERFSKYGAIVGVALNKGFGFVQFEREESALQARQIEHGAMFHGKRLDVKAITFSDVNTYSARGGPGSGGRGPPGGMRGGENDERDRRFRDRSPFQDRMPFPERSLSREREWRERDRDRYEGDVPPGKGYPFESEEPYYRGFRNEPYDEPVRPPVAAPGPFPVNIPNSERTNDCEIIVMNKKQREYAEMLEHRLKKIGLTVDLLFPNEEVPIGKVLGNIMSRGTLFAVTVLPQNEQHRSLTLNILHGKREEHRNMPADDALNLVASNFAAFREKTMEGPGKSKKPDSLTPGLGAAPLGPERHPDNIQAMLQLLVSGRPLTVLQYDRLIIYLKERKEHQMLVELGETKPPPLASMGGGDVAKAAPAAPIQSDLQSRILGILNRGGNNPAQSGMSSAGPPPTGVPPPSNWPQNQSSSNQSPLLNDPTVQKALDSLMQADLLRKISGGGGGSNGNPGALPVNNNSAPLGNPPAQPLFGAYASGPRGARRF